jgi:hypothetical protein
MHNAGLPREEALRVYTESMNKEDTLFTFILSLPGNSLRFSNFTQ